MMRTKACRFSLIGSDRDDARMVPGDPLPKKPEIKSCHVGVTAGPGQSLDIEKSRAFVRWKDGGSSELSESELRAYIDQLESSGTSAPKELGDLLGKFGGFPENQRD